MSAIALEELLADARHQVKQLEVGLDDARERVRELEEAVAEERAKRGLPEEPAERRPQTLTVSEGGNR